MDGLCELSDLRGLNRCRRRTGQAPRKDNAYRNDRPRYLPLPRLHETPQYTRQSGTCAGCRVVAVYPKASPDIESSVSASPGLYDRNQDDGCRDQRESGGHDCGG